MTIKAPKIVSLTSNAKLAQPRRHESVHNRGSRVPGSQVQSPLDAPFLLKLFSSALCKQYKNYIANFAYYGKTRLVDKDTQNKIWLGQETSGGFQFNVSVSYWKRLIIQDNDTNSKLFTENCGWKKRTIDSNLKAPGSVPLKVWL